MHSLFKVFANPTSIATLSYGAEPNQSAHKAYRYVLNTCARVVLYNTFLVHVGQIKEFYLKPHTAIKR